VAILFCNIGWMELYQGLLAGDQIVGGGSYVKDEGRGNEVCNFSRDSGFLHGYVQPPGDQIDIDRIGASPDDDSISGVTVIWTATRPTGGTAVVGWYKNATVFRNYQKFSRAPAAHRKNGIDGYWIKAHSEQGTLLAVDERTCEIPRQVKGGMGQANLWYADGSNSAVVARRVLNFVRNERSRAIAKKGQKRQQDQERKVQIERAAIRTCCDHFERIGYTVKSVEKDNVGWDLEARSGKTTLCVEVKGLAGSTFSVELTPNEYQAFSEKSDAYRLGVVLRTLEDPELVICRYSSVRKAWIVDGNKHKSLQIQTKQGASIKCI